MAAKIVLETVESRPSIERARSGRTSMYPEVVEKIVAAAGEELRFPVANAGLRAQRRKGLLEVPVTGGALNVAGRLVDGQHYVYARFERKGRAPVTVAGKPLGGESAEA